MALNTRQPITRVFSANAASPEAAMLAVSTELDRRGIAHGPVTEVIEHAVQRDDDHVAIVVTRPAGDRITYGVIVALLDKLDVH